MKKNWLPILICIGFILGYQAFVLKPWNAKNAPAETLPVPKNGSAPMAAPNQASAATTAADIAMVAVDPMKMNLVGQAIPLANSRKIMIGANGSIGAAEFDDFFVRGKKEKENVRILRNGFHYTSNVKAVNDCLGQLNAPANTEGAKSGTGGEKDTWSFASTAGCKLSYKSDPSIPGLLSAELSIPHALITDGGSLEITSHDFLGAGPEPEQNALTYRLDGKTKWLRGKNLLESQILQGKVEWISWGDKYFASFLLPEGDFNPNIRHASASLPGEAKDSLFGLQYPLTKLGNNATSYKFRLYFGTRDTDTLQKVSPTLIEAVELGWFAIVSRVLLTALTMINKFVHNFGVSIILLTLVVRVCFWPLNKKVFASAQKMKALQPQIDRIKKKYGGDKSKAQEMNVEVMSLYKKEKVNPLGSCLPMLAQMPIFIGLYGALNHSLDLYQAPFFGWITDLSSRDPYFVFPVLWTLSLFAYIKVNPQMNGPTQPGMPDMKFMQYGMNFLFGFLSKDWPAGLTLYLFVSNLVGIAQQLVLQRGIKTLKPIQEGA